MLPRLKRYKSTKEPRYAYMTTKEYARSIGSRGRQIAEDPTKPVVVHIGKETESIQFAYLEMQENVIPIFVVRNAPDSDEMEFWILDEDQHIYKDLCTTMSDDDDDDGAFTPAPTTGLRPPAATATTTATPPAATANDKDKLGERDK